MLTISYAAFAAPLTGRQVMNAQISLEPVDAAYVTILVDNFVDILLPSGEVAQRPPVAWDIWERGRGQLIAEHGLSLLLTVERNGHSASLVYDAGLSRGAAIHNMDVLEVRLPDLRAVVLSHGHSDHHGGLEGMIRRVGARGMPLVIHPEAWRDRKVVFPTGAELHLPPPSRRDLDREGVEVTEECRPSLLIDGTLLVTGQVERVTDFEEGFPLNHARSNGGWEPDPWIWDDQAVVVNEPRGQGPCRALGLQPLWDDQRAAPGPAVDRGGARARLRGRHAPQRGNLRAADPRTVDELAAIGPRWLVPGHCTGWRATHELARRLPGAYVQASVGIRLRFA
jgi:7,8-dihydropterin-6-yl-methyl-4-(beta-D-ribofuranosyl)aminobenzene 5'-phosphate synthase